MAGKTKLFNKFKCFLIVVFILALIIFTFIRTQLTRECTSDLLSSFEKAKTEGNITFCSTFDDRAHRSSLNYPFVCFRNNEIFSASNCFIEIAEFHQNISFCIANFTYGPSFEPDHYRECFSRIRGLADNPRWCSVLSFNKYCLEFIAIENNDLGMCDNLVRDFGKFRFQCYNSIAVLRDDITICKRFLDEDEVDYCRFDFSEAKKDSQHCLKISRIGLRQICLNKMTKEG